MARKGARKALKREYAPKIWPIHRKEATWSIKAIPGPHPTHRCLPLALILRDILKLGEYAREVKKIIVRGMVKIDGRVVKDPRFPVGIMDVISIPEIDSIYRIFPSRKGLILHPIDKKEENIKLCRIESKKTLKGGRIQLNLHDGRNIIIPPSEEEKDLYRTLDVLKITLPDQDISEVIKLSEKAYAMVIGGKNMGVHGRILSIERKGDKRAKSIVTIENDEGEKFQTILSYAFILGSEKLEISVPEAPSVV